MPEETLKVYSVWDRTTRWFHWINVMCVVGLMAVGVAILNSKALGVSGDGKVLLKTVHVYIGYVFSLNFLWRIVWGFAGNKYARWRGILPIGKGYWCSVVTYTAGFKSGNAPMYVGHNPLGKLMVGLMILLLATQAVTGLILAGTDLYLPPFGHEIKEWVTARAEEGSKAVSIKPGSKKGVDPEAYAEMRSFRQPIITIHYYAFYVLLISIVLHIAAVVVTEIREKNGIVSAMFTGKKVSSKKPVDLD